MCDVPEGQREKIKDGISLFEYLIKRDIINEQKLDKLRTMLKNLGTKRRDLIKKIDDYEKGILDDKSSTMTSNGSMMNNVGSMPVIGRSFSKPDIKEAWCTVECPCMMMSCYKYSGKIAWSYVAYFAFFLTCFLTVVLLWYADVPKASEAIASDEHVKEAAPFILVGIVILFLAFFFVLCYVKKRRDRQPKHNTEIAEEENGMQEVHTRNLAMSTGRPGRSKIEKKRTDASNLAFIEDDAIADSGAEDLDADQDAKSPGSK
jgi:hypothetical protein